MMVCFCFVVGHVVVIVVVVVVVVVVVLGGI